MTQQEIRTKRLELEKKGAEAQEELNKLQSSCTHPNIKANYKGVVNVATCPDCGYVEDD